jgi:hypothetical protein
MMGVLVMPQHGLGLGAWDGAKPRGNRSRYSWGGLDGGVKGLRAAPDGSRRRKASSKLNTGLVIGLLTG